MRNALRGLVVLAALAVGGVAACDPNGTDPSATASAPSTSTTGTTSTSPTTGTSAATMTVSVYFSNDDLNPGIADCTLTFPVEREVAAASDPADVAEAALTELLTGPTPAEEAEGYTSWFSDATEDDLISVRVDGDTAYVDLVNHAQVISNASTSCGSALYLSELGNTVKDAAGVTRVLYAFDGDPEAFWEWLQVGCYEGNDNCDPAPFAED